MRKKSAIVHFFIRGVHFFRFLGDDGIFERQKNFRFLEKALDFAGKAVIMKARNGRKGSGFPWDAELSGAACLRVPFLQTADAAACYICRYSGGAAAL
ncbi:MAG: hypothetical protein MR622_07230 [Clostridiales bacterium]|nr:hypothetical protein [Clostridiales bacterium]